MKEKLYQYIWQHRLWPGRCTQLTDGRRLEVLDTGILNTDAGPDFFNAKIRIDGELWAGNVELHCQASDWHRHGHDSDPAYDGVILHVVGANDAEAVTSSGRRPPQLLVEIDEEKARLFEVLVSDASTIRCRSRLQSLSCFEVISWLDALAFERLAAKASRIRALADASQGDWQQAAFVTLCRSLGFSLNALPFEMLGKSVSLNILSKHSNSLFQLEAILFGQAGMLDESLILFDDYYQALCREYAFLMHKYSLRPIDRSLWKFARTRPANMPHRRIALLAALCVGGFRLLRDVIEATTAEEVIKLFDVMPGEYWRNHYAFGAEERRSPSALSDDSKRLLIINLAVPLRYAMASLMADHELEQSTIEMLEKLPPERNSIVTQWGSLGIKADNAMHSQALIHLRKEYCDRRRCIDCRFARRILRPAIPEPTLAAAAQCGR